MSAAPWRETRPGFVLTLAMLAASPLRACHRLQPKPQPLATVAYVDPERYAGRWYEIAKIPNRFQRRCVSDATAHYTPNPNGTIAVVNCCRKGNGEVDEARAIARVVEKRANAKLEVSFFSLLGWRPAWGEYWVLALGAGYDYAVVGEPTRRYGWILSRAPTLPAETRNAIDRRLGELGYLPEQFENSTHATDRWTPPSRKS